MPNNINIHIHLHTKPHDDEHVDPPRHETIGEADEHQHDNHHEHNDNQHNDKTDKKLVSKL